MVWKVSLCVPVHACVCAKARSKSWNGKLIKESKMLIDHSGIAKDNA